MRTSNCSLNISKTSILTTLFVILPIFYTVVANAGGQHAGGGGLICKSNIEDCTSLPGAGLRVASDMPDRELNRIYSLPAEILQEVQRIFDEVPLPKSLEQSILRRVKGSNGTYRLAEKLEQVQSKQIKEEYNKVVKKYGASIDMRNFVLPAWSETCDFKDFYYGSLCDRHNKSLKTYLLPEFHKLSLRRKALVLIHEANYRGGLARDLEKVLVFDLKFEEMLNNPQIVYEKGYDLIDLGLAMDAYIDFTNLKDAALEYFTRKTQSFPTLELFCHNMQENESGCDVSFDKLSNLSRIDKRLVEIFDGKKEFKLGNKYDVISSNKAIYNSLVQNCLSDAPVPWIQAPMIALDWKALADSLSENVLKPEMDISRPKSPEQIFDYQLRQYLLQCDLKKQNANGSIGEIVLTQVH